MIQAGPGLSAGNVRDNPGFFNTTTAGTHIMKSKKRGKNENIGLLFIAPAMIMFFVYILYPIIYIVVNSLYQWDGINAKVFVSFHNFIEIFTNDSIFKLAFRNGVYWIFLTIFPQIAIGFSLAYILNYRLRGRTLARAIIYMPVIISPVVIGIVWQRIYNPFGGLISDIGIKTGAVFLSQPYISDPKIAIFSTILVNVWQWSGFSMLMYLAGMQSISEEIFEASTLEGATKRQEVRHIIWPMLKPTHLNLILLGVIGSLQTFDLVYVLTNGGPNNASQMLSTYIFLRAFKLQSMGYGSAISVVTLLFVLILSLVQIKVLGAKFTFADY